MTRRRPFVVGITQARMNSSRLPGKILLEAAGKPLLQHHVERLSRARTLDLHVLATTDMPADDPVEDLGKRLGVPVVRGSETDVLDRFYRAASAHGAEVAVRFTGDCPLIDPGLVDDLLTLFLTSEPALDYACIDVNRLPRGLDAEAMSRAALDEAWAQADQPFEREHVTPYIYHRPDRFRLDLLSLEGPADQHRWCVDTAEDLELVRRLLDALLPGNPGFGWRDCLDILRDHPDWVELNRGVAQKPLM